MLTLLLALGARAEDRPERPLQLHGWAEAGLTAAPAPEHTDYGVEIAMARLQGRYEGDSYGGMLQVEAKTGTVELLDAFARVGDKRGPQLRIGRFKTAVSSDYAVPAPQMTLPSRALLVSLAPQRAIGVEGSVPVGRLRLSLGAFDPSAAEPLSGMGILPVGAADLSLTGALSLHAAASGWLRPAGAAAELGDGAPGWDSTGDAAIVFDTRRDRAEIEGLAARRVGEDAWDLGVGAKVSHRFPAGEFEIEPVAGWDLLVTDEPTHRLDAALNLHHDDWLLVESISLETVVHPISGEVEPLARLQLQAGF